MNSESNSCAILGGGTMGADIAALFLSRGWRVHVHSRSAATREALRARVERALIQLGRAAEPINLIAHAELEKLPWSEIGLVIESVKEDLPLKREVFARLEALSRADIPLASNSSGFPISEIGVGLATQRRMLNLHFFMPAHLVPLVEVVSSTHTAQEVARQVLDIVLLLGHRPVLVRQDIPGFLANRLQHALMREAWSLVERGIASIEDVDAAVRYGFGFRFIAAGPILQKELSGLDVHCASAAGIYPDLCTSTAPSGLLREKVAQGRLGMKSGEGFYKWDEQSAARERERYARMLTAGLRVLQDDLLG